MHVLPPATSRVQVRTVFLLFVYVPLLERWRKTTEAGITKVLKMLKASGGILEHCKILVLPLLDAPPAADLSTVENKQKWHAALSTCEFEVLDGNHRVAAWEKRYRNVQ